MLNAVNLLRRACRSLAFAGFFCDQLTRYFCFDPAAKLILMKKDISSLFILMALLLPFLGFSQTSQNQKKAVFIIIDGVPADVVERLNPPNLARISKEGGYTRAYLGGERNGYSETPTISAVGYNSLLTGTWVNKHNVFGNGIENPNYHYWTIFRFLREAKPDSKLAIYSTWLDNRTKLLGDGLPQTGRLHLDFHFDGLELDTMAYPHTDGRYIHFIDEAVSEEAAKGIRETGPDLTWVYLQYTDDIGHGLGDGKEMDEAVMMADRQIGRVYNALLDRQQDNNEDWEIYITTDHGRDAATGQHHGGQSIREKTIWIATNAKNLNRYFYAGFPAVTDIMPSLARHLDIDFPEPQAREIDGIPLTGEISLANADVFMKDGKLNITWEAFKDQGEVNILMAETNHFKTGGTDNYKKLGSAKLMDRKFVTEFKPQKGKIYKFLIEGQHNRVNRWLVE